MPQEYDAMLVWTLLIGIPLAFVAFVCYMIWEAHNMSFDEKDGKRPFFNPLDAGFGIERRWERFKRFYRVVLKKYLFFRILRELFDWVVLALCVVYVLIAWPYLIYVFWRGHREMKASNAEYMSRDNGWRRDRGGH